MHVRRLAGSALAAHPRRAGGDRGRNRALLAHPDGPGVSAQRAAARMRSQGDRWRMKTGKGFLFTSETLKGKPAWLRAQLASAGVPVPVEGPESSTPSPNATQPPKPRKRARNAPAVASVDRPPRPKPQSGAQHAPDATAQAQALYPSRVLVRVESRRCGVQCDPDNILVKWHIDALRYAGILSDDTSAAIDLRITETRVATRAQEGVEILITPLP